MTFRKYLSGIALAGSISWLAWILVVSKLNPFESTSLALILFFISLLFALTSTFTLLGFFFRKWLNRNEIYYEHLHVSLRQGALLSFCSIGCLIFLFLGILTWWNGLLLVTVITLVEFYFTAQPQP